MPLVQLDFPNPLNTSVQIGDTAYFSNPIEYGTTGNPLSGDQWASTTTPHLTSNQSDIKKIGVITEIITWDGTVSSIICDMPQNLFNQYFSDIQQGGCVSTVIINPSNCTGQCCTNSNGDPWNFVYDFPVVPRNIPGLKADLHSTIAAAYASTEPLEYFFSNPSTPFNSVAIHQAQYEEDFIHNFSPCEVFPGEKNVNGVDDYVGTTNGKTVLNYWTGGWGLGIQGDDNYANDPVQQAVVANWPGFDNSPVVDFINYMNTYYPNQFYIGMSYAQAKVATPLNITGGFNVLMGSSGTIPGPTNCTTGSFIMFSKDNKVNLSSVLGYYASATFRNDSTEKAELFNVGADVFESSK